MTDVLRTNELQQSSFVEPMKPLPTFTKKQKETYDDLLKKNFSDVTPRNKTILFKKVVKNGDTKMVEEIVKNIIEYDMQRTKKSKDVVQKDLRLKLPKSERVMFEEILKGVSGLTELQPKSLDEKAEKQKRQDRIMDDFSGPAYQIGGGKPSLPPPKQVINIEPVLNKSQMENIEQSGDKGSLSVGDFSLDLDKVRGQMTMENFNKLKTAYNKLNSIVNQQTLEDGSFFTKGAAALGAPEVEMLQMASKMLGLGFDKKDKSDLRKILDGEDTGRGTMGDIGLIAKMFVNPDEIGGMITHQGKKWGKQIADDASDFWDSVRGRKRDIYTTADDRNVKDVVASRQADIKKDIDREKDLARLNGREYKGTEYDPDALNRLLEVPKLSQYGGRDDFSWDEKLGKTFRDIFGINPMMDTGDKKERLERELRGRDPEGYRRYKEAIKKYEATKKKISIRGRNSNIQKEHGGVRKQLGDIINGMLDDNSKKIKSGKDSLYSQEQIEDYYDLANWLKSNDEMSYHNLAQIADNFIEDTKSTLPANLKEKLSQWTDEQKDILGSLGQGDVALDVGSDEAAAVDVKERVEAEARVASEAEERAKRAEEREEEIKQEEIDKENEETLKKRPESFHQGFVNTDNRGIPDLRPTIVFGNTDMQYFQSEEEVEQERNFIDSMSMWKAGNDTEQNRNDNIVYQTSLKNQEMRYEKTFAMPKVPKGLGPVPEEFLRFNEKLWIPYNAKKEEQLPMMRDNRYTTPIFQAPEDYRDRASGMKHEFKTRPLLYPEAWSQGYDGASTLRGNNPWVVKKLRTKVDFNKPYQDLSRTIIPSKKALSKRPTKGFKSFSDPELNPIPVQEIQPSYEQISHKLDKMNPRVPTN